MTITFADGTHIEVAADAFNDFIKYDLKWVEFVHGRASEPAPFQNPKVQSDRSLGKNVQRCPSRAC
ncbi:MAG TPA: hypothetical protein VKH81_01230 [Candidatus Angelobacter sp.]|nr:hypothetical protein [Candidatus Angelobacter sp.]